MRQLMVPWYKLNFVIRGLRQSVDEGIVEFREDVLQAVILYGVRGHLNPTRTAFLSDHEQHALCPFCCISWRICLALI